MTQYGPWIQEDDYDAVGGASHLGLANNATDYHSSFPGPTPIDAGEFQNAWQGAEASSNYVDFAGYAGTTVLANVDGSPFPPWDPTTYDGYHGIDPIYFEASSFDLYYPNRGGFPVVPPGWDGYEFEDGIGWSAPVDAVLEAIMVNDSISANLSAGGWQHQLLGTTDYVPPIVGHVPTFDPVTYVRSIEYAISVTGNTSGFYQRTVGLNVFDLVTTPRGSLVLVNTHETSSVTMAAEAEGTYQWGSFISSISDPAYTYLRYVLRPPRYRFYRENRYPPARRLWPRRDALGVGIGRLYPPPDTQQQGRGIGPASPV